MFQKVFNDSINFETFSIVNYLVNFEIFFNIELFGPKIRPAIRYSHVRVFLTKNLFLDLEN